MRETQRFPQFSWIFFVLLHPTYFFFVEQYEQEDKLSRDPFLQSLGGSLQFVSHRGAVISSAVLPVIF